MYVEDWQDFVSLSEELFRAAPLRVRPPLSSARACRSSSFAEAGFDPSPLPCRSQTRFCTKYRHSDGILVLKVTDDVRVRHRRRGAGLPRRDWTFTGTDNSRGGSFVSRRQCLKYKTDQAADVRKLEKLNAAFLSLMARGPDVPYGANLSSRLYSFPLSLSLTRWG